MKWLFVFGCLAGMAQAQSLSLPEAKSQLPHSLAWQKINLTLQNAARDWQAAQHLLSVGVSGDSGLNAFSNNTSSTASSVSATLSLPVLPWASAQQNVQLAKDRYTLAQKTYNSEQNNLYLNVYQQYYAARAAQLNLALAQHTLSIKQQQQKNTEVGRALNNATRESEIQSVANTADALLGVQKAQNTLQLAQYTLSNTLGVAVTATQFDVTEAVQYNNEPLNDLQTRALSQRSEILSAKQSLQEAQTNLDTTRRERYTPNLNLTAKYNGSNGTVSGGINFKTGIASLGSSFTPSSSPNTSYSLGISASYNLLDPSNDSKLNTAEAQVQHAQIALSQVQQTVSLDVAQKYADVQNAVFALNNKQTLLTLAQTALETARVRNQVGLNTALDIENSLLQLEQSQKDLEQALQDANLAQYRLLLATGGNL